MQSKRPDPFESLLLAKNHRWDEIDRVQDETRSLVETWLQYWLEVATIANDQDDLERIDKSIEQIRKIAGSLDDSRAVSIDGSKAAVAEFLSLEAKVEYLHRRVLKEPENAKIRSAVSQCLNGMNRCTGRVNLFQGNDIAHFKMFYDSQAGIRSLQQYVLLEAWRVPNSAEGTNSNFRRETKRRGLVETVLDQRIEWTSLELPDFHSSMVTP